MSVHYRVRINVVVSGHNHLRRIPLVAGLAKHMLENTQVVLFGTFAFDGASTFSDENQQMSATHLLVQEFIREAKEGIAGLLTFQSLAPMNRSLPAAEPLRYTKLGKECLERLQQCANTVDPNSFVTKTLMYQHIENLYNDQSQVADQRTWLWLAHYIRERGMIPDSAIYRANPICNPIIAEMSHIRDLLLVRNSESTPQKYLYRQLRIDVKKKMNYDPESKEHGFRLSRRRL